MMIVVKHQSKKIIASSMLLREMIIASSMLLRERIKLMITLAHMLCAYTNYLYCMCNILCVIYNYIYNMINRVPPLQVNDL